MNTKTREESERERILYAILNKWAVQVCRKRKRLKFTLINAFFSFSHENEEEKSSEKIRLYCSRTAKMYTSNLMPPPPSSSSLTHYSLSLPLHICTRWIAFKISREKKIHDNSNIQWKTNQYTRSAHFMRWKEIRIKKKIEKRENKWAVPLTRFGFFTFFCLVFLSWYFNEICISEYGWAWACIVSHSQWIF